MPIPRWCTQDPTHFVPPRYKACAQCGEALFEPNAHLDGSHQACPDCGHENLILGFRAGDGVCEQCGRLLAICANDGTLLRAAASQTHCPRCGDTHLIPPPDTWAQPGAGPAQGSHTPERLFRREAIRQLVPAWDTPLESRNPVTRKRYSLSAPAISQGLVFFQDGNRKLHAVDIASGGPLGAPFPAFDPGGPHSAPAAAGGLVYLSGTPGRVAAFGMARFAVGFDPGTKPTPEYGLALPTDAGTYWQAARPPVVSEASNTVVCVWERVGAQKQYRISAADLTLGGTAPGSMDGPYSDSAWRWIEDLPNRPEGQPVIADDGTVFVATSPGLLHRFSPRTGSRLTVEIDQLDWAAVGALGQRQKTQLRDGILLSEPHGLLIANTAQEVLAFRSKDLEPAWRTPGYDTAPIKGVGCLVPGRRREEDELWLVNLDRQVLALQVQNGTVDWRIAPITARANVSAPPSACADFLLLPAGRELLALRWDTHVPEKLCELPEAQGGFNSQLAVAYERVVAVTSSDYLVALQVAGRSDTV
jgi:outer membrane protein assembly factor BamB/ribosomal protein S27E